MIGYTFDDGGRADAGYKGSTGDCVTRAIAIITGQPYKSVYKTMAAAMKENGYSASGNAYATNKRKAPRKRGQKNAKAVQAMVMQGYGLVKVKLPKGPRPTYTEASAVYGNCIVSTTRHLCAIVDGKVRDTFDDRVYEMVDRYTQEVEERERKAQSVWVLA